MQRTVVHLRRLWSISSWAGTAVLFILLGGLLVLRATGTVPLVEQTGSMRPQLTPGDLLLVKTVPVATVRPGDVVTFAHPSGDGRTITHRVMAIEAKAGLLQFTTKGDANRAPEHWAVPATGRIGTLAYTVPSVGRVTRPIDDPKLRAVLIMLMSAATSVGLLLRIWRRPRRTATALPHLHGFVPAREYR